MRSWPAPQNLVHPLCDTSVARAHMEGGFFMAWIRCSAEQIIGKLREAVRVLRDRFGVFERRVCKTLKQPRASRRGAGRRPHGDRLVRGRSRLVLRASGGTGDGPWSNIDTGATLGGGSGEAVALHKGACE